MFLEPIPESGISSNPILSTLECLNILEVYRTYYPKIGFELPWIGYFIINDGIAVGTCSFTGKPKDNRVEVAYYTFPAYERKGYATWACRELVRIAKAHKPDVIVTAKTAPEENPSTTILRKNNFKHDGIAEDEEIGPAWYWILEISLA
jgi:[ribosomal protein S5]-alanine N-acetyltransferase